MSAGGCQWPEKYRHASKKHAAAAIGALWRDGKGSPDMTAYPCPGSKPTHWHIGHDPKKFRDRIRRVLAPRSQRRSAANRRRR